MSEGNVERIKRGYEALSRLDAEALVAVCEPDIEFRSRIGEAEDVTYHGHDGVRDHAIRFRTENALWWDFYSSREEALEAMGLTAADATQRY
jgi:ketosteroid isomerase-like protein